MASGSVTVKLAVGSDLFTTKTPFEVAVAETVALICLDANFSRTSLHMQTSHMKSSRIYFGKDSPALFRLAGQHLDLLYSVVAE